MSLHRLYPLCYSDLCQRQNVSDTEVTDSTSIDLKDGRTSQSTFFGNPAKLLHKANWCVHKAQISCTYRTQFLIFILQFFLEVARIFPSFSREGHSLELPFSSNAAKCTETVLTITFSEELQGFFWLPPDVPHIVS